MKKQIFPLLMIIIVSLTACRKPNEDQLNYEDIVKKVEKAHATLTTYRDSSTVTANYITANPFTVIKKSKLVYSSDGRFRYEYREIGNVNNYYVIHRDVNKAVKSWWKLTSELKNFTDITDPLAAATGVSDMTAFQIPSLLLPVEFDNNNVFKTMSNLSLGEDEIINGKDCYLVQGYNIFDDLCKIYIQKDNYLIRRFSDSHTYDTFDFNRVIDFYPEMNITIPDAEFLFNAPK